MRVHPGVAAAPLRTGCRALVGGFGLPTMRDLDFGRQFVDYAEALEWPADVVVEDLPTAPHLVLHRLQELRPAKVVLVGSVERGTGGPGAIRRYRLDVAPPEPGDVHLGLTQGLTGAGELHHTLGVLRHWGALPPDTVIVEVEPADTSFGLGFSEEVGSSLEATVDAVRAELEWPSEPDEPDQPPPPDDGVPAAGHDQRPHQLTSPWEGRAGVAGLREYAAFRDEVRDAVASVRRTMLPGPPRVPGVEVAARARPLGTGVDTKGDWYDFIHLADDWVGIAVGDVVERGLEAAMAMSHLRSSVRAAALASGLAPGNVLAAVDRVVGDTGLGTASTLVYLAVNAASGVVRLANAGHCRPLVVSANGSTTFVGEAVSPRLGVGARRRGPRPEAALHLSPASRLLLYTDGLLVDHGWGDDPLHRLVVAAANGPSDVDRLCDHLVSCCLNGVARDDDASLVALRLTGETAGP